MSRRGGRKARTAPDVSCWLLQVRKNTVEDAPLVVPKVIRQYVRKKKVPAEQENKFVPSDVAEHTVSDIPDIKISKIDSDNDVNLEESNVPQNKNSDGSLDRQGLCHEIYNHNEITNEYLTEIRIKTGNNTQDICSNKDKDTATLEQEYLPKIKISNSNISEKEQQQLNMDIAIKIEPADDSEYTEDHAFTKKPKTDSMECELNDKLVKIEKDKEVGLEVSYETNMGQKLEENYLKNKTLLTEEIDIKEEIESDYEDNDISDSVISNVKQEPVSDTPLHTTGVEQVQLTNVTNGCPSLVMGNGVVLKPCKKPDVTVLKKCFLVAVNVAPGTSDILREPTHIRPLALQAASSQEVVGPEMLAGLKVVAKSQIFMCDTCGKHFLSKTGLHNHIRAAHSVARRFKCDCGAQFTHNYMLQAHMQTHTGQLVCDICSKSFCSVTKLTIHLNTHLRERLFSCPICTRRYPVLSNLQRHVSRHKTTDIFKCTSCAESYRCMMDLRRHSEREHGDEVDFPCYVCSRTLHSYTEFVDHVRSHDNALFECAFCFKRYVNFEKWEEHSAAHIEGLEAAAPVLLPYVCRVCKKRFDFRSVLRTHMSSHTGDRPYECRVCPKTFKTRSAAMGHERGHERPFGCPECPARFAKRETLSRHVLLHSGERPHVCATCARAFTQRSAMMQHVQRFHTPGLKRKAGRKRKTKK